jgi:hypothetical protein
MEIALFVVRRLLGHQASLIMYWSRCSDDTRRSNRSGPPWKGLI